jgi:DNA-directed RNA polymerase specialized sigma24 family protein
MGRRKLKMLGAHKLEHHVANHKAADYATPADFCRIFTKEMNQLYLLSFLLTADRTIAEKCFVEGLDSSQKESAVFKEWAQSWARRTIIANAIRMVHPRLEHPRPEHSRPEQMKGETASEYAAMEATKAPGPLTIPEEIEAIVALTAFDRFAFVISVLEGYSDREASLLLNCGVADLVAARIRALQKIGGRAELHRKLAGIDANEPSMAQVGAAYAKGITSPLVASA